MMGLYRFRQGGIGMAAAGGEDRNSRKKDKRKR